MCFSPVCGPPTSNVSMSTSCSIATPLQCSSSMAWCLLDSLAQTGEAVKRLVPGVATTVLAPRHQADGPPKRGAAFGWRSAPSGDTRVRGPRRLVRDDVPRPGAVVTHRLDEGPTARRVVCSPGAGQRVERLLALCPTMRHFFEAFLRRPPRDGNRFPRPAVTDDTAGARSRAGSRGPRFGR